MNHNYLSNSALLLALFLCFFISNPHLSAQPVNDTPCSAIEIECAQVITSDTYDATVSAVPTPTCANGSYEDVFYKITTYPNISYSLTVSSPPADFDGVLIAYTGECSGTLTEIACADDGLNGSTPETITFTVLDVQDVIIRTYDWAAAGGTFELTVDCIPMNDHQCDWPDDVYFWEECGTMIQGSTAGATPSEIPVGCSTGSSKDVFYLLHAFSGYSYEISLTGFDMDGVLNVYNGSCLGAAETYGCSDNIGIGVSETVSYQLFEPELGDDTSISTWIQIYDYYGNDVDFELEIICTPLSPNDDPENAIPLNCGETLTESTIYATESDFPNQSCAGGGGSHADVFYSFTAYPGVNYQILNNGIDDGTNYDGVLTVYSGELGVDLVELACSDLIGAGQEEEVNIIVSEPTDLLIRTFDYSTTAGSFEITMNCTNLQDTPCDAVPIACDETLNGTTIGASYSGITDASCSSSASGDVFYTFEGEAGYEYTASINGDNYDAVLIAYSGTCDGLLTELACADNGLSNGVEETVTFILADNATILLRTMDWYIDGGEFEINLSCIPPIDPPSNDLCADAQELPINNPGLCPANQVIGTTIGATQDYDYFPCDLIGGVRPDVFYSFNSGSQAAILLDYADISQGNSVLEITEGCNGTSIFCLNGTEGGASSEIVVLNTNTDYIVRVSPVMYIGGGSLGQQGEFSICLSSIYDCPDLDANVGDPCDDGNPETNFDVINDACECVGVGPCQNESAYGSVTLVSGASDELTIDFCSYEDEYNTILNAEVGESYTFTSTGSGGYMTVRSGTYDGPVLGSGYNEITVISDMNGPLFLHLTLNEYCETSSINCVITTVQCITCIFDCPALDGNIGGACDDDNPDTIDDEITADCECIGTITGDAEFTISANWNTDCSFRPYEIAIYQAGTNELVGTYNYNFPGSGTHSIIMDYLGTFDLFIKIDGFLRKGFYNYEMNVGDNFLNMGDLTPGDLNGDNGVNVVDFSILSNAFGSSVGDANFNSLSDLNCDGGVNIVDFSMLSASFGMEGVPLP